MFENSLYPGIGEMLAIFGAMGYDMYIVTAKPCAYARQILEHFGIVQWFREVHGPELGERTYTKESLIGAARLRTKDVSPAVMIGDRAEDVSGAKMNGMGSVAVTWGYGERDELEAAQPDAIVASSQELIDYVCSTQTNSRMQPARLMRQRGSEAHERGFVSRQVIAALKSNLHHRKNEPVRNHSLPAGTV
jgi:ribonucleotide monophosphatase NagD (HAD superfamily)